MAVKQIKRPSDHVWLETKSEDGEQLDDDEEGYAAVKCG
jgi:hypothetical protein